jgi:hypothetical protein
VIIGCGFLDSCKSRRKGFTSKAAFPRGCRAGLSPTRNFAPVSAKRSTKLGDIQQPSLRRVCAVHFEYPVGGTRAFKGLFGGEQRYRPMHGAELLISKHAPNREGEVYHLPNVACVRWLKVGSLTEVVGGPMCRCDNGYATRTSVDMGSKPRRSHARVELGCKNFLFPCISGPQDASASIHGSPACLPHQKGSREKRN